MGILCFTSFKFILFTFSKPAINEVCRQQPTPELHLRYVNKATKCLYQIFYFTLSAVWGYFILQYSEWLPWFLGGANPEASILKSFDMNYPELPIGFYFYVYFTMGYHLASFIELLIFGTNQNDFREMLLHHIATCALYFGFIFSNIMGVGGVIAWLHDIADVFVALSRFLNCIGFEKEATFSFWIMYSLWFLTRIVILPIYIY